MELIGRVFNFLTTMPGNLVYILVLEFILSSALSGAVIQWRATGYPQTRRTMIGLALLVAGQLALFMASGLVSANIFPATALPPIDQIGRAHV